MGEDRKADAGLVIGVGAAIAAAWALLRSRPGENTNINNCSLDEATMKLLIAIAEQAGKIDDIVEVLQKIAAPIPNADKMMVSRIQIGALNTGYQLPDISIPDGFQLLIKAAPGNFGIINVALIQANSTNPNQSWPLIANENVGYRFQNAKAIWVSGTVVGDFVYFTVEQRSNL